MPEITEEDETERPITRSEFVSLMRKELRNFDSRGMAGQQPFYKWFVEFESDVFAPEGP